MIFYSFISGSFLLLFPQPLTYNQSLQGKEPVSGGLYSIMLSPNAPKNTCCEETWNLKRLHSNISEVEIMVKSF